MTAVFRLKDGGGPADIYDMSDLPNSPNPQPKTFYVSCRSCSSPLMQATDWARQDEGAWSARLWCPECWHERRVVLDREQAIIMSLVVEEGIACLLEDLVDLENLPTVEPGQRPGLRL